ncbi:MAG: sodium:proton antiporter [Pseudomonadota bacterium]
MTEIITLQAALILGLGLLCQWVAWKVKLPAILFLLLVGLALGPGTNIIDPDQLLGDMLFPFVSLSIAIILFEGSLTLNFKELKGLASTVRNLVTIGAVLTWIMIAYATHLFLGLDWQVSILFGAIVVVTGPTVIMPMLKSIRPNQKISNVLRWEGIVIDPIGAMLAVLVYEYIVSSQEGLAIAHTIIIFTRIVLIGCFLGAAGGYILGTLIKRHWVPEYLHNFTALAMVLLIFSLSNNLEHESGLFAVTVMGVFLANMKDISLEGIYDFKEHLSVLLISSLFIILAARIDPNAVIQLGWPVIGLLLAMQFIIRPIVVFLCAYEDDFTVKEKLLLSWVAPRGIVAAAISALFALRMEKAGFEEAPIIVALTFAVILGTVILQSATSGIFARLLGVAEPSPRGILFIGANRVAREMALALKEYDFRVLLADTSWEATRLSRMAGLETFYGNPLSEYAEDKMDLIGIGKLVAVTPQRDLNALANLRFKSDFGKTNIYSLATSSSKQNNPEKHSMSKEQQAHYLSGPELTFSKFSSLITQGAKIRTTSLSDNFLFEQLEEEKNVYPLFAIDKKNALFIFSDENDIQPKPGWKIISLDYNEPKPKEKKNDQEETESDNTVS